MPAYSILIAVAAFSLQAILLLRAKQEKMISHFPVFYSYVAYVLVGSLITLLVYWVWPQYHASVFWFRFMITVVVEFAILVEVSDHIFDPYPVLRYLGLFIILFVGLAFLALFILPPFFEPRPSSAVIIIDLVKRSSLTKAVIILCLLAAARYCRLPLSRNVSGLLLGFSVYLGTNVANFALLETFGGALYDRIFAVVGPLSFTLGLFVWVVSLWRYEPVPEALAGGDSEGAERISQRLSVEMAKLNAVLFRLLGK